MQIYHKVLEVRCPNLVPCHLVNDLGSRELERERRIPVMWAKSVTGLVWYLCSVRRIGCT